MRHTKRPHPLSVELRALIRAKRYKVYNVCDESGIVRSTFTQWFNGQIYGPRLDKFDQVLRILGYRLAIVPIEPKADDPFLQDRYEV